VCLVSRCPPTPEGQDHESPVDLPRAGYLPHIGAMQPDLSDEDIADLNKLRPEPARQPLPPSKIYAPPSRGRYRRRG
jgi:hypothetical protein